MMPEIRPYQEEDFQSLCAIFIASIKEVASQHYSPRQVAAWAQVDDVRWKNKLVNSQVLVAVINNRPVGFLAAQEDYIDLLFVAPEFTRQGIARSLLMELFKLRPGSLFSVDASITARPLFERLGFDVIQEQNVESRGVQFINYHMVRQLAQ